MAQNASLGGRVLDPAGKAVAGAALTLTSEQTNVARTTSSNGEGVFAFPSVELGSHRIEIRAAGFKHFAQSAIAVRTADNITLVLRLELGQLSETVTVAGRSLNINESDATVGTVVDRQFVENLPMNGRSFHNLIAITPGVVQTAAGNWDPGQFSVNGQRTSSNYFTVDGVSANFGAQSGFWDSLADDGALAGVSASGGTNSLVSIDAMEEFKIQTSTYAPEFGRQPGGQIQIATRSGTNNLTFTLFDYFRNDVLDANDWFANRSGLRRPALRQNDFGGVVGGPVLVPGYNGRNRTFFFASYEGLRLRQPQFQLDAYPTMAARASANASTRPLLSAYPIPNGADLGNGTAAFAATFSNPSTLNATSFRIDHYLDPKISLFGRFNEAPSSNGYRGGQPGYGPAPLSVMTNAFTNNRTMTVGSTQVLSPAATNEVRFNYSRSHAGQSATVDSFGGAVAPADSLLFPSFTDRSQAAFAIVVPGYTGPIVGSISDRLQQQINVIDNFSWVARRHQLKFGFDYRRMTPEFGYPAYSTQIQFATVAALTSGMPTTASRNARDPLRLRAHNFSLYAQDTWRASERLTLTYGLRWEVNPAPNGLDGKPLYTVDQVENPLTSRLAPAGSPLYGTQYGNIAPRVGIAYRARVTPNWETILRAGTGYFYDIGQGAVYFAGRNPPYRNQLFGPISAFPIPADEAVVPPFNLNGVFGRIETFDPNLKLPRITQFNVAIEQALGRSRSFTVTYAGAEGRRLARQLTYELPGRTPFTRMAFYFSDATSSYHSLQLQFQQRITSGLQMMFSHVYAHSIDDGSDVYTDGVIGGDLGRPSPRLNRGSSDFDIRHAFNGAVSYELPRVSAGSASRLINGWAVDSTLRMQSAAPVDVAQWTRNAFGSFTVRPDLNPGVALYLYGQQYPGGRAINPAAFAFRNLSIHGALGRNSLRAFPLRQWDLAVRRRFALTERLHLQLRGELFNVLNRPNFASPIADTFSPFFGQATQMFGRGLGSGGGNGGLNPIYQSGGPRSVQFALKLQF
ncbi:MAG TPA: TonB-dependent receptor [Bryobacteraceae bacterium]|nr:TonB-dependent receptor [Bryobacteraceae bacterium]